MTTETKSQPKDIDSMDIQELREELKALRESEAYYHSLFDNAPVALHDGDFSGSKAFIDDLRAKGGQDLEAYFEEHPEAIRKCISMSNEDVCLHNKEFLNVYKYNSTEEFFNDTAGIDPEQDTAFYTEDFCRGFGKIFVACANGATRCSITSAEELADGQFLDAEITWVILPGYEDTWGRVMLSIIPLDRMREDT